MIIMSSIMDSARKFVVKTMNESTIKSRIETIASFECTLETKRDERDLTAVLIITGLNALAFTTMVLSAKYLADKAALAIRRGVRRNDNWLVFSFCERPRIVQHNMVPSSTVHHNHPMASSSPHYSFAGISSKETSSREKTFEFSSISELRSEYKSGKLIKGSKSSDQARQQNPKKVVNKSAPRSTGINLVSADRDVLDDAILQRNGPSVSTPRKMMILPSELHEPNVITQPELKSRSKMDLMELVENKVDPTQIAGHHEQAHENSRAQTVSPETTDTPSSPDLPLSPLTPGSQRSSVTSQTTNSGFVVSTASPSLLSSGIPKLSEGSQRSEKDKLGLETYLLRDSTTQTSSGSDTSNYPFWGFFLISDQDMLTRRGVDALNYIIFLRHIIYYLTIITALCGFVILPINFYGDAAKKKGLFARLTIENVPPKSDFLWAHVIVANLFMPIGIVILYNYYASTKFDQERYATRTLFVRKSSNKREIVAREGIAALINEIMNEKQTIEGIQFVYDVRYLEMHRDQFIKHYKAERFCRNYLDSYDESFELRPYILGQWLGLAFLGPLFPKTYGLTYYHRKKWESEKNLIRDYSRSLAQPQGAFFITFQSETMARTVYRRIHWESWASHFSLCRLLAFGRWKKAEAESWLVSFAPDPGDINWYALVIDRRGLWARSLAINSVLFIVFFFCTTPSFILPFLKNLPTSQEIKQNETIEVFHQEPLSFLTQYFKPLILLLVASILPSVVYLFSSQVPDTLKSEQTHAVMWRVYCFSILMIIIIPSFGQSSFHEVVRSFVQNQNFHWYCLFHSYEYSFFVIYVVQSAFIGNGLELLNISRIVNYFFVTFFQTSSEAENDYVISKIDLEFTLGLKYSRILFMITMVLLYAVSCPLIALFGLIFIVIKYWVDRQGLYHSYYPSQMSIKIYRRITTMFFSTIIMMQFHLFTIVYTKNAPNIALAVDLLLLLLSVIIFPFLGFLVRSPTMPFGGRGQKGKVTLDSEASEQNWCCCAYLPEIIKQLGRSRFHPAPFTYHSDSASFDTLS